MKIFFFTLILFISKLSVASDEEIYNALSVRETALNANRMEMKYEKSVGGLTCVRTNSNLSGDNYACSFSQVNGLAIYSALNVPEESVAAARIDAVERKTVGRLVCTKTSNMLNGDSADCSM